MSQFQFTVQGQDLCTISLKEEEVQYLQKICGDKIPEFLREQTEKVLHYLSLNGIPQYDPVLSPIYLRILVSNNLIKAERAISYIEYVADQQYTTAIFNVLNEKKQNKTKFKQLIQQYLSPISSQGKESLQKEIQNYISFIEMKMPLIPDPYFSKISSLRENLQDDKKLLQRLQIVLDSLKS